MMSGDNTQNLAEKIANLLQNETQSSEFQMLQSSIEKLNQRLDGIEKKINSDSLHSSNSTLHTSHPSQEKHNVIEAIVDKVMGNAQTEKTCTFEPNDKPCDFCSMCSSRGF